MASYKFDFKNPDFAEYIKLLFKNTKDGKLNLFGWYYDTEDEEEKVYHCDMSWDEKDAEVFTREFSEHLEKLKAVAEHERAISEDQAKAVTLLSKELANFWDTYLKQFRAYDDEKLIKLEDKEIEELSEEDKAYIKIKHDDIYKEAAERLNGEFAYDIIARSKRVCRLISLGAPAIITENESKTLLEAMLLNKYCTKIEKLTYSELPIEELEKYAWDFWMSDGTYQSSAESSLAFALKAIEKGSKKCFKLAARLYELGIEEDVPDIENAGKYYELAISDEECNKAGRAMILENAMNFFFDPDKGNNLAKAVKYREMYQSLKEK